MKSVFVSFLLLLGAIDFVNAQCCSGSGPSIPANTASACVSSTSGAFPATWTLLPATGAGSCASVGSGYTCLAYKCTASASGASITMYGQECATPSIMTAAAQAAQSAMSGSGMTYTCGTVSNDSSSSNPRFIVLSLLATVNVLFLTLL